MAEMCRRFGEGMTGIFRIFLGDVGYVLKVCRRFVGDVSEMCTFVEGKTEFFFYICRRCRKFIGDAWEVCRIFVEGILEICRICVGYVSEMCW